MNYFSNQIFRQELLHVYEQKSKSRDELVADARKAMQEMTCPPGAEQMIWKLSKQLSTIQGKRTYRCLPKPMKNWWMRSSTKWCACPL